MKNFSIHQFALIVLLTITAGFAAYWIALAVEWVPYPNQIDFGEGFTMYVGKLWATGGWNWDINTEPYITLMYGPTLPAILAPLINWFGWSLELGRMMMVVSTALTSFLLYKIAREVTGKRILGVIAALLPFTQPALRDWSLMARPDMLAIMFSVIGIWIVLKHKDDKWLYLSIPCFILAMTTKFTAFIGVAAVFWFLFSYKRKTFYKYVPIFLGAMGMIFLVGDLLTSGEFHKHVFEYNGTVPMIWQWEVIINSLRKVIIPLVIPLFLATMYVARKFKEKSKDLLPRYFVIALVVSLVSMLREGSFINYNIEFIFVTCLCCTLALPMLISWEEKRKNIATVGAGGILIALLIVQPLVTGYMHAFPFPNGEYEEQSAVVSSMIQDTSEPIVTENAGLVLNAGKVPYIEPFVYTNLVGIGAWKEDKYLRDLEQQRFDYIIAREPITSPPRMGQGHFTLTVIQAINENYTITYQPEQNIYWYGLCVYEANRRLV